MKRTGFLAGLAALPVVATVPLPKPPVDYAALLQRLLDREWALRKDEITQEIANVFIYGEYRPADGAIYINCDFSFDGERPGLPSA